ncbi:MAG: bifunctional adenosylcobinamide kinase/adenosylcobinamide-phosphate guanylyltransferase [Pseudomonadota bacterium]
MKCLFIGGIKSGKSLQAEQFTVNFSQQNNLLKPVYLATCEFKDEEMLKRINKHQQQRKNLFVTIEEALYLDKTISNFDPQQIILIECVSIWLNNMLYHKFSHDQIFQQVRTILQLPHHLVFVQNDVGCGIIPDNPLAREYLDLSGKISQLLGQTCDHVFFCIAGLKQQMK